MDYLKGNAETRDGYDIGNGIMLKKAENDVATDENVVYYEEVTKDSKTEKRIVIYLPQSLRGDRAGEAKKQFENILNSNLIQNSEFNLRYVDVPSKWIRGDTMLRERQMPGIAVRVDNAIKNEDGKNIETFPVMSATKCAGQVGRVDGSTKFLTEASRESFFDEAVKKELRFYDERRNANAVANVEFLDDGEHTERQWFYSLIYDNITSNGGKITLQGTKASNVSNSTFFVWTKGNPCITDANFHYDNGGGCCSVWYKNTLLPKLKEVSSKVFIYFNNVFSNSKIWLNASDGHKTLVEALSEKSITATYEDYFILCEHVKDKQVLGVRMVDTNVPDDFEELLVNVDTVEEMDEMKKILSLTKSKIPYVVDYGGNRPLSYSFTTAGRDGVIELLNRWMDVEAQPTIQFVDHYKN